MSHQMSLLAGTDRHPDFEHVAVYHEGDEDLAERLTPHIARALDAGDAVLVSASAAACQRIAANLGPSSEQVEYVADDVRYDHPNAAMRSVHDFVRSSIRNGARAAWTTGAIPFDDDSARNADWMRYEQAVNEVLKHLPLRAVCAYDVGTTSPVLLHEAHGAHSSVDGAPVQRPAGDPGVVMAPIELPNREPLLYLQVQSSRSARHTVTEAYRELIGEDALADLTLIVSEVVSNALNHGAPPVTLTAWFRPDDATSVIDVSDHGNGIDDPFVDLRPPRQRPGGAGMWIVGQLSERVRSRRTDGVHHVTAIVRHRAQSTD